MAHTENDPQNNKQEELKVSEQKTKRQLKTQNKIPKRWSRTRLILPLIK